MPETSRVPFIRPTLTRRLTGLAIAVATLASVVFVASPASAAPTPPPVPAGVYLSSPWAAPGSQAYVHFVGVTTECGDGYEGFSRSWAFVGSGRTTPLEPSGFGEGFWVTRGVEIPSSLGAGGPVTGTLRLTCTPLAGGAAKSISLPLTISANAPATIYHSPTAWTWHTPGALGGGAVATTSALGFAPGESVTVSIVNETRFFANGDFAGAATTPVTATADGEGAVTADVTLLAGWSPDDDYDLVVAGATSRYLLVSGAGTPSFGDPSIALSNSGTAFRGGAVGVQAAGFEPGETVTVALHSSTARASKLGVLAADSTGAIAGSLYLPAGVAAGEYRVWAGANANGYQLLNAPLTIGQAPAVNRVSGGDRYETAVATAQSFAPFAAGTGTVYLTSGAAFPDALGAGALAASIGAPVLLTDPSGLPDPVRAELLRLRPAAIKVVGGTAAVSKSVFTAVQKLGFTHNTTRIGGSDRFDTNRRLIADALGQANTVYIAVGSNFPDALAAGPAAAQVDGAVVLVNGAANALDQPTLDLFTQLGVTDVRLVGGTNAMSVGIENQLRGLYADQVTRYAGSDRYETAAQIVGAAWPTGAPRVILASGANFPDALAAGALGLPMLTSGPTCSSPVVLARLGSLKATQLTLIGGTSALGAGVATFARC